MSAFPWKFTLEKRLRRIEIGSYSPSSKSIHELIFIRNNNKIRKYFQKIFTIIHGYKFIHETDYICEDNREDPSIRI